MHEGRRICRGRAIADLLAGLRALRAQISQKDVSNRVSFGSEVVWDFADTDGQAEIAILSTKLASAKATVVRATAADNINKKKSECQRCVMQGIMASSSLIVSWSCPFWVPRNAPTRSRTC